MSEKATYVFGAKHAEIASITSEDPISQTISYATALDVPGLKSVVVNTSTDSKELRGDNTLLAKETVVQNVEVVLEFAKWDADVFAVLTGATVEDLSNGYSVKINANNTPGTFSLLAQSVSTSVSGSTAEIYFPKLRISNIPDMLGLVEEDFKTVSVTCEVIPTAAGDWVEYRIVGGATNNNVIVPDVIGLTVVDAQNAITAAGLTYTNAVTVTTEPLSWGTIVFTDPAEGTSVPSGSSITLIEAVETLP